MPGSIVDAEMERRDCSAGSNDGDLTRSDLRPAGHNTQQRERNERQNEPG